MSGPALYCGACDPGEHITKMNRIFLSVATPVLALSIFLLMTSCDTAQPPQQAQPIDPTGPSRPEHSSVASDDPQEGMTSIYADAPLQRISDESPVALPGGFPEDIPLYPGSRIVAYSRAPRGASALLRCEAPASLDKVLAFYKEKAAATKWSLSSGHDDHSPHELSWVKEQRRFTARFEQKDAITHCVLEMQ